jgi:Outer membrane protein beta-barrel domain
LSNRILLLLVCCGLVVSASAQSSFDRYTFSVGGGPGIGRGYVSDFVGNSYQGTVGGGINFNKLFSADAEYMYYDLKVRPSVGQADGLADPSGHFQSISLDGIVNAPRHIRKWGAYGIFGVGFDDRSVSVGHSELLINGTVCPPTYYRWWGINCFNNNPKSPPTVNGQQTLFSHSKVAGSYNYGGGITYRLESWHHARVYLEYRYHHAYQSDAETLVWPLTIGLRW